MREFYGVFEVCVRFYFYGEVVGLEEYGKFICIICWMKREVIKVSWGVVRWFDVGVVKFDIFYF